MHLPSIYSPEGTFTYLMIVLGLALVASILYLWLFTTAGFQLSTSWVSAVGVAANPVS